MLRRWRHALWQRWLQRCANSALQTQLSIGGLLALSRLPGMAVSANHALGQIYAANGDHRKAVHCYEQALAQCPARDATLYHHAAEVSFKLVSEEGGEAIADVEWTVKTADGATVFSDRGAFPSTVLAQGEYLVLAKLGDQVFNREIEIQPGSPREIELLTSVYSG